MKRLLFILLLLAAGAGCTGGRAALAPAPDPRLAAVKPGDRVALRVYREPEMSDTFPVAASGDVTLPKLGRVAVAGRSIVELQDSLRTALGVFLRNPSVEVTVLRRVGVQGAVRKPDLYLVDLTMTLRDVIAAAGGVSENGDARRITIVREGRSARLAGGEQARFLAAELSSGDQVVVAERSWISRNVLGVASAFAAVVPTVIYILDRVNRPKSGS